MKKVEERVDKWREQWYSIKAVRETAVSKSKASLNERTKNHLTVRKKFLTSEPKYGKLIKSPARATDKGEACRADLRAEKSLKKL